MADKEFRDPPPPGKIERALERATDRETRLRRKHEAVVEAGESLGSWESDGVRFTITAAPKLVSPKPGAEAVAVTVLAVLPNGDLLPGLDNPYLFVNPPIMVPDGTWRKEAEADVANMAEDPAEALRQAITQVVIGQARKAGWAG